MRINEGYKLFWQATVKKSEELLVAEPMLPRKHKTPRHLEVGTSEGTMPATPEDHYRAIFFESIDVLTACVKDMFEQEGYKIYKNCSSFLY